MFDDVLLPTESNLGSERAVDIAVDLADRYGAVLHVLYVVESVDRPVTRVAAGDRREALPAEEEAAIANVEDAARESDVPVRSHVGTGEPDISIPRRVERIDADLVVMGTHGRSGVERILVGSVAEKVVREVDEPVLVVPLAEEA